MTNNHNQHQKVADELERRLKAPARDAAEGVRTIDSAPSCGQENDYRHASIGERQAFANGIVKGKAAAPPKPAPDAVREALQRQCDNMAFVINHCVLGPTWYDKFKRELGEDRNAIAAPVPSPDGASKLCYVKRWRTLVSLPAKYADEILEALRVSPSPAVAAEPETEQQFEDRLFKQDAADMMRLLDYIADKIGLPHDQELSRENFNAWLAGQSAPDRETAAGAKE